MKHLHLAIFLLFTFLILPGCNRKLPQPAPAQSSSDNDFKVVGYLQSGNLKQIDRIQLHLLTHLDLAFANPDKDGNLIFRAEEDLPAVVKKCHEAGVRVFISIAGGGINEERAGYWLSALQPENRTAFVKKITDFVTTYDLDGVDVDIEWNLIPTIGGLYTPFVVELKNALHALGKEISSALNVAGLHKDITQESLNAYDFINVMVYDKTGPWRPNDPGPHAPFSYAEEALQYWTEERKIPAEKLTLGVPFYGYEFDTMRSVSYQKIVAKDPANAYLDELGSLYYNGIPTIVKKTQLAKKSFGGIMIWELTHDTSDDLSLLRAISQTIQAGDCDGNEVTTYFADQDRDGHGDIRKPFQACKAPRGYVSNSLDCDDTNKKIHPGATEIKDGKDNNCDGRIDE